MQVELNSPTPEITVLVHGTGSEELLPQEQGLHVVRRPQLQIAERALNLFVLVTATGLPDVAEFVLELPTVAISSVHCLSATTRTHDGFPIGLNGLGSERSATPSCIRMQRCLDAYLRPGFMGRRTN